MRKSTTCAHLKLASMRLKSGCKDEVTCSVPVHGPKCTRACNRPVHPRSTSRGWGRGGWIRRTHFHGPVLPHLLQHAGDGAAEGVARESATEGDRGVIVRDVLVEDVQRAGVVGVSARHELRVAADEGRVLPGLEHVDAVPVIPTCIATFGHFCSANVAAVQPQFGLTAPQQPTLSMIPPPLPPCYPSLQLATGSELEYLYVWLPMHILSSCAGYALSCLTRSHRAHMWHLLI